MLSTEIKVNGCLVGHLYCHNQGPVGAACSYFWRYHEVESGHSFEGTLCHHRKDNITVLVGKILQAVAKQRQVQGSGPRHPNR